MLFWMFFISAIYGSLLIMFLAWFLLLLLSVIF